MRSILFFSALVLSASAQVVFQSAAASNTHHTPQELYLSKQAYGNFACKVNSVVVSTENPGDVDTITSDMIRAAFANTASLEWAHVAQASFSSLDGRNEEKVLGTPGGDMGEFILAIHAYSKISGSTLSNEDVYNIMKRYLKVMTREKFSYETDEKAYIRLAVATGCRNLKIAEMGGMKRKREGLLAQIGNPDHIGDPFIKYLAAHATELDLNPDYISAALAAFHNALWTSPSAMSEKLCYLEMKGPHREAAIVNVKVPEFCNDQGLAPMVSQQFTCPAPVLVNHGDAVKILRRELVSVLTEGTEVNPRDVLAEYNQIAEGNFNKFLAEYAPGLPIFTVEFLNSSPLFQETPAQVAGTR